VFFEWPVLHIFVRCQTANEKLGQTNQINNFFKVFGLVDGNIPLISYLLNSCSSGFMPFQFSSLNSLISQNADAICHLSLPE